jgi:mRNA-degrading endonuclease RelE of RelBE toxin-antitoxin system
MAEYRLLYHTEVASRDITRLDPAIRKRIRSAVEHKLQDHPEAHAEPLAHTTQRLWSLRVGDWRLISALRENEMWILKIGHRRDAYGDAESRPPPGDHD